MYMQLHLYVSIPNISMLMSPSCGYNWIIYIGLGELCIHDYELYVERAAYVHNDVIVIIN